MLFLDQRNSLEYHDGKMSICKAVIDGSNAIFIKLLKGFEK
jgi:hypothetical protein